MPDRRRLRTTFEEVPELYERARPLYPPELFDDLVAYAGLEAGSRVLEIGCGTGQATLPLAERGLAVAETAHVQVEGGDPFWAEVQADYDAVVPSEENRPPPRPEEVGDLRAEIEETGLFAEVEVRRYLADVTYSAEEYVGVLDTYSPNRAMEPAKRERLFELIRRRVEASPGGMVRKTYLFTLNL